MNLSPGESTMANPDRLSPLDASFLHIEGPSNPMHVGAVCTLDAGAMRNGDGWIDQERMIRHVENRLHSVPRFRQRVSWVPFGQGRPLWVDDLDFNIRYHVRFTALPSPGGDAELKNLVGRLMSQHLDRHKPLWELYLVDGLERDRIALVWKTHHCMVDGVSGMELATVLFDLDADYEAPEAPAWEPRPTPSEALRLVDALIERSTERAELARSFRATLRAPRSALKKAQEVADGVTSFLGQGPAPKTCLNAPIGPHRRFETVTVPLSEVKEIKNTLGGTVNDVVLAGVAGCLRRFLLHRGEAIGGMNLRVMVPVSVRAAEEQGALGNRVSGMMASLPVGDPDPVNRFRTIRDSMAELKRSPQAMTADAMMGLTGFAPATILQQAARVQSSQRLFNLCVTNVPGPQFPLYVSGAQLENVYPTVPIMANLAPGGRRAELRRGALLRAALGLGRHRRSRPPRAAAHGELRRAPRLRAEGSPGRGSGPHPEAGQGERVTGEPVRVYHYRIDPEGRVFHDGTEIDDRSVIRQLLARVERDEEGRPFSRCMGERNYLHADDALYVVLDFGEPELREDGSAELRVSCQGGLGRRLDLATLTLRDQTHLYGTLSTGHVARFGRHAVQPFVERWVRPGPEDGFVFTLGDRSWSIGRS